MNVETKHTPGPLEVCFSNGNKVLRETPLINAAPEMLEALKFALDMLNHLPDRIGGIGTKYVKERMQTVIAKAEGN